MSKPNVLFFILDQLNFRCLGYNNHPVVTTPNLDALRQDAVSFSNTYAQNGICMPSRVSFLSGQYLHHHRQFGFTGLLDENTPSMARTFAENGYYTYHVGKGHVNCYGDQLGFNEFIPTLPEDIYRAQPGRKSLYAFCESSGYAFPTDQVHGATRQPPLPGRTEEDPPYLRSVGTSAIPEADSIENYVADEAIEFIGRRPDKPFFMHVSFDRPHGPHSPSPEHAALYHKDDITLERPFTEEEWALQPEHFRQHGQWLMGQFDAHPDEGLAYVLTQYYALITHIDTQIGRVIQALKAAGLYDDTVIVFTSDHGDLAGYGQLFEKYGNRCLHDDVVHIPLLIKYPNQHRAGQNVTDLTESVDVFPTLAKLCDINTDDLPLDGIDLTPVADGMLPEKAVAFSENYSMKMLRDGDFKLIYYTCNDDGELYDLANDPNEYRNLYGAPECTETVLALKLKLLEKLSGPVSDSRQSLIRSLLANECESPVDCMDPLYKWDNGIIEGGGFWQVHRDGYKLTCVPFDGILRLEQPDPANPGDDNHWRFVELQDVERKHALLDEVLDYICTKIRPISTFNAGQHDRDMMFQTRGFGFC